MDKPKQTLSQIIATSTLLATLATACLADLPPAPAIPGGSTSFGKTLSQWQEIYWRWFYNDLSIPTDVNGNPVVDNVVLMRFPVTSGDGTAGVIDLTLKAQQPFMLPLWNILGNAYNDGSIDPYLSEEIFRTLDIKFAIDGVTVVNTANVRQFYTKFDFNPPIPYNFPPAVSFIFLQGIGITHAPLTPGNHVFTLDAKNTDTVDFFGIQLEYHNTWNVTVLPSR
jgi:hypothetical protein